MKGNSFSQVILLVWLTVISVRCEHFSSVHQLTKLVNFEEILLEKMERYITLNEDKLDYLKEKLLEFEGHHQDALEDGEDYLKNPINAYLIMKRLSVDWERIENLMEPDAESSILKDIDDLRNKYNSKGENDKNGVIKGILRLQQVYRLKTNDVVQGILGGVKYNTSSEFSAKDCFDFGKVAVEEYNFLLAHSWLLEALDRFENYNATLMGSKLKKSDVLELLADVKFKLGDFKGAADIFDELKNEFSNDTRVLELHSNYTQHGFANISKTIDSELEPLPSNKDILDEHFAYRLTCGGHIQPPASSKRLLRCRYHTKTHHFLRLAPIKLEELSWDPYLVLFHEVIYESEIDTVIKMASNKITRSRVIDAKKGASVSDFRTSQTVFFPKEAHIVLQTIDQRVSAMTGLSMEFAEQHQIANYGVGGHYAQHVDFFFDERLCVNGNRIATVLFFMSDVEKGGGTAFPYISSLVEPRKGSAAFWYNLHKNGDGDSWTLHGGCPVLVGSKWVLNRWIRERGQEFLRPCDLVNDSDAPQ